MLCDQERICIVFAAPHPTCGEGGCLSWSQGLCLPGVSDSCFPLTSVQEEPMRTCTNPAPWS